MNNYTIVEPSISLIPPPTSENYLEFLEICTRNCYKSEDKIAPGSAAKLLDKVVRGYNHISVVEHLSCIVRLKEVSSWDSANFVRSIVRINPMFADRISYLNKDILISGNIRMWMELVRDWGEGTGEDVYFQTVYELLSLKWPFFFECHAVNFLGFTGLIGLVDENPITNMDILPLEHLEKHATLTYRIICSRSTSLQLIRHRKGSISQESQRYCNYQTKGIQIIKAPKSILENDLALATWQWSIEHASEYYNLLLSKGIKAEDAREVLPNCTKTELIATFSICGWRHLFEHRGHNPGAQEQIRQLVLDIESNVNSLIKDPNNVYKSYYS